MHSFTREWFAGLDFLRIKDPGNAGVISLDNMGLASCGLVTAGAETRTVNAPTRPGQMLLLFMDVDGGDGTVTVKDSAAATTFTHVFNDAGDFVLYVAIEVGTTLKWAVVQYSGLGAALTAQLTSITIADAAGTPDYALQAVINTNAYGFASAAEAITFLYVVQNLQVRVAELEAIVEAAGLAKAN
jgi:hypothetical protein